MNVVVYIAGPMRGQPDLGRHSFQAAETCLRNRGFSVLNPACLPDDLPQECYMPICLAMVREADIIALLPGWETSKGAFIEVALAREEGKTVWTIEEMTANFPKQAEERTK